MTTIKNRYDFVFLFDVKDGNPNGDPDFDNMPRTDEETNHGLVTDVCIKRKIRNYVQLLKGLESPYDIFIREGNVLNPLIEQVRNVADQEEEDEKKAVAKGRMKMCEQYFDIRTFGAVMSTGEEKADADSNEDVNEDDRKNKQSKKKGSKKKESKRKIKGLGVVRGPVQLTFARSIDPVDAKSHSLTRCCVTTGWPRGRMVSWCASSIFRKPTTGSSPTPCPTIRVPSTSASTSVTRISTRPIRN